jgi:hypothetical protein
LAEHILGKDEVTGPIPVMGSNNIKQRIMDNIKIKAGFERSAGNSRKIAALSRMLIAQTRRENGKGKI